MTHEHSIGALEGEQISGSFSVECGGQAKQREPAGGVEEEADPGDPTTRQLEDLERPRHVATPRSGRLVLPECRRTACRRRDQPRAAAADAGPEAPPADVEVTPQP